MWKFDPVRSQKPHSEKTTYRELTRASGSQVAQAANRLVSGLPTIRSAVHELPERRSCESEEKTAG